MELIARRRYSIKSRGPSSSVAAAKTTEFSGKDEWIYCGTCSHKSMTTSSDAWILTIGRQMFTHPTNCKKTRGIAKRSQKGHFSLDTALQSTTQNKIQSKKIIQAEWIWATPSWQLVVKVEWIYINLKEGTITFCRELTNLSLYKVR